MAAESKLALRSVDSVASIYAIVIGLALTEAIETLVGKTSGGVLDLSPSKIVPGVPGFVALLVTLVPFWHGMNRHLDRCYVTKTGAVAHYAILIDFFTFFLEAILLFVAGWSLRQGLLTFYCLGALLLVDTIWGGVSHNIHFRGHKSHISRWASINFIVGIVGFLVIAFPFEAKPWVLMALAIARTVLDYWLCGEFYFPEAR